jgi:hypothetical protein
LNFVRGKGKAFAWQVTETERRDWMLGFHPYFDDRCQLYALAAIYPPGKYFGSHFCSMFSEPQRYWMRAEGLGRLKISKDPARNRARDLPSWGTVPHLTAPPLAPPPLSPPFVGTRSVLYGLVEDCVLRQFDRRFVSRLLTSCLYFVSEFMMSVPSSKVPVRLNSHLGPEGAVGVWSSGIICCCWTRYQALSHAPDSLCVWTYWIIELVPVVSVWKMAALPHFPREFSDRPQTYIPSSLSESG